MRVDLRPMMNPKSVAVIGASRDPNKVGHVILQNYVDAGFKGKLYPVNKNITPGEKIIGLTAYRSVVEIKKPIDLAVIAVPAPVVPEVLEECGKAKVKTAVVISGGFAEVGNVDLQEKIVEIAKKYNIAMLGPNCLGIMDPSSRVDTLFLPTYKLSRPRVGEVSFISQSGAVGSTILDLIAKEGFGLAKFISYGNAAYVDEVDLLEYLMHDKQTKVIVMYIEGVKRGKEFIEMAKKVSKVKPIVVIKGGITEEGARAAHSHTAALAGNNEAYEAVFKQFGFIRANDLSDLLYFAKIFSSEELPKGDRVAIITNGGGTGVLTADAVYLKGLKLAEFSEETKKDLRKVMPDIVNIRNPLDLAGDADEKRYSDALSIVSKDPNVDMLIVIALFQTPGADSTVAAKLIYFKKNIDKPMVVITTGADYTQIHKLMMESSGLPVYDSPMAAASALAELYKYWKYKNNIV
ncbi:MAG: acetate--CoA ligase family protein [Candidatus Micrarchaeia archaeon]|jgi:acetyl coenzyme A synthetase (ADP forming)-like protein